MAALTLADAPLATPVTVVHVPPARARQFSRMGLRQGTSTELAPRRSGDGRVVAVAGSRVALGGSVLRAVAVEVAP